MAENVDGMTPSADQAAPIVIATDFSPDSEAALAWAGQFAALTGAQLVVLHVIHDPADAAGFYRSEKDGAPEAMSDVAQRMMTEFLAKMRGAHPDSVPIQTAVPELITGLPASRIVELAEREGARLIVIGSRGLTGLSSILVGSVAERVAQHAPMPVVIVKSKRGRN